MTTGKLCDDRIARPRAAFDAYATDYTAGMENPLKAVLGATADQFVELKLRWMLRRFPSLRAKHGMTRVLDYGCGSATLLRLMAEVGAKVTLAGCDVSPGMLDEAERRWPQHLLGAKPALHFQQGARTPFQDEEFDLVVISSVLHHVPPADRPLVYSELRRVTSAGGHIVVFEHNPFNPLIRFVVSRTLIDRDAVLLRPGEVARGLTASGATDVRTRYLMFMPPRMRVLDSLEEGLGWLPMGGQYVVTATVG